MSKITFFYCTGTAFGISILNNALKAQGPLNYIWGDPSVNPDAQANASSYVPGLNGKTYPWDGAVYNDPFPFMLNPDVWNPVRIAYADAALTFLQNGQLLGGMGASIDDGVSKVIAQINALPAGAPFAIGGYSQGAAVMSSIYNEIRTGSLTSRASSFLGGVVFGNPRRQLNHRGEVGGTWSGAWDVAGSYTGGHGSFPATGPWARLSGCDGTKWIDFAAPLDIFSSTGDSAVGQMWTKGNDALLGLLYSQFSGDVLLQAVVQTIFPAYKSDIIAAIQTAFGIGNTMNYLIDPTGLITSISGGGHTLYPALPPPNNTTGIMPSTTVTTTTTLTDTGSSTNVTGTVSRVGRRNPTGTGPTTITHDYLKPVGDTCYQVALKWLEGKAATYATAPVVLPSTGSVGWSTTLVPPAS